MFPPDTNILIVDDSDVILENVRAVLNELGYQKIAQAEDGVIAMNKLEAAAKTTDPFQLVISDWNMPNMSGIDFLRKVRAISQWKDLPFVLLTAVSQVSEVVEAITAGVSTYLVKPVDQKTMKEKLEGVWKKHNPKT